MKKVETIFKHRSRSGSIFGIFIIFYFSLSAKSRRLGLKPLSVLFLSPPDRTFDDGRRKKERPAAPLVRSPDTATIAIAPLHLSLSLSRSGGVPWDGPGEKAHKVFYNDLSADPLSRTVSSVRPQDGAKEMERNEATAKHVAWPSCAWLLLRFFPFPVGHSVAAHVRHVSSSTTNRGHEYVPLLGSFKIYFLGAKINGI